MFRAFFIAVALTIAGFPLAALADPLLVCGWDTVYLLETSAAAEGKIEKLWKWDARQCKELPENIRATFRTTDDCKPLNGGSRVLISSSSGGCALVERPSGKAIWYASVPNAHSVELLPRDRIVVASSTHANGNRLVLFNVARSNEPIWETPLPSAHGVVWDEGRKLLWALGLKELRAYELRDWNGDKPSLAIHGTHPLPDSDGHDLQAAPRSNDLIVTTGRHVYLFDREKREFRLHPELGDRVAVKSVSIHPASGRAAFVRATESWWSDTIGLLTPAGKIQLPGERIYKARWLVAPQSVRNGKEGGAL